MFYSSFKELINDRLKTYPGAHPNEKWKLETDLNKCTVREKEEMERLGTDVDELMSYGLDRGQVAHVLFGYKHEELKREHNGTVK